MKTRTLSIPLNCVDKCELSLDDIDEPALIHAILSLQGRVDHARLNEAIRCAQQAHPIMRTILRSKNFKLFRQIQEGFTREVLTVQEVAELPEAEGERHLFEWISQPMDVRKDFPLRVLLQEKKEAACTLVFAFHHSSTDGRRAVLFVRKAIECYDNEVSQGSEPPDTTRISRKGDELLEFAHSQRSRVRHYYMKMTSSLFKRFVIAAFTPPTRVFHDRSGHSKEVHLCFASVGRGDLEQVQSRARSVGSGLNDVLLAACHRVVERWNAVHGRGSRRIRIMVPVDIGPKRFRNVVSNQASWISPSTVPEDRADPARLLQKVRTDTRYAARNREAFSLVYFFYFCSRFPLVVMRGICRFLMITRTYVDTILFTNVGLIWPKAGSDEPAVSSIGSARIVNVTGSAPVVTPMGLSICASVYDRTLNLCLTYRPALFSKESAEMFLSLYAQEIRDYRVGC